MASRVCAKNATLKISLHPSKFHALAEKIPGAWLVQLEGGGHGLMFQFPEKIAKIVETFLQVMI